MLELNDKYVNELSDKFKESYLEYKRGVFDVNPWGSHQPLVIHTLNTITEGDVIEVGIGDNSTPLLHLLCEKQGRKLFSYEFETNWYDRYKLQYENDNHKMILLNATIFYNNEYTFNKNHYAIAFIDCGSLLSRQHAINFLKDSVDYFIVHDTSEIINEKIIPYNNYDFSYFKNVMHFNKVKRTSTLFSNKEISRELHKIFE